MAKAEEINERCEWHFVNVLLPLRVEVYETRRNESGPELDLALKALCVAQKQMDELWIAAREAMGLPRIG